MEWHQSVLQFDGATEVTGKASGLEFRAKSRRDIGRYGNAAMTAMCHVAECRSVLSRKQVEIRSAGDALERWAQEVGGGVLDAGNVTAIAPQPCKRLHGDVDDAAWRDVIDDDRKGDCRIDRTEMLIDAFLCRLVVVGRNDQQRIGAGRLRVTAKVDRLFGAVRASSGDDRNAPFCNVHGHFDQPLVFGMRKGRALAGRPAGHYAVAAFRDLPLYQRPEGLFVDHAVEKWRDERRNRSFEHCNLHCSTGLSAVSAPAFRRPGRRA
ncbi:hypothetical protein D9M72_507270 [compost metagenome]